MFDFISDIDWSGVVLILGVIAVITLFAGLIVGFALFLKAVFVPMIGLVWTIVIGAPLLIALSLGLIELVLRIDN